MSVMTRSTLLAGLAALAFSSSAGATVLDFNGYGGTDLPGNSTYNSLFTASTSTLTIGDFQFASSQEYVFTPLWGASDDSGQFVYNGTDYMGTAGSAVMTSLTGPFSVSSLDLKGWAHNPSLTTVVLTGVYAGSGATHSTTITLDPTLNGDIEGGNDFTNYVLSGFTGLSSFTISGNTSDHVLAFDNIDLTTVPEPGSLALVGLGLAGFAAMRRRKQK